MAGPFNTIFIKYMPCFPNRKRWLCFLILFPLFSLLFTGCRKEDEDDGKEAAITSMLKEINADSLKSHVTWLQGMGTRFALADNHRSVAVRIRNKFIGMGYSSARLDSFSLNITYRGVSYNQWQYNVIAILNGTEYPDSVCILGSHYDDIVGTSGNPFIFAPGAHDNASGTAATLEVARVMKKKGFEPRKSIMFIAFGAEELGLFGSNYFASNPGQFAQKIVFMLNNDMIAYNPDMDPASWLVNILDYPNSRGLRSEAEKLILKYTSLGFINDNQYNKQSDSYPFSARGYKALFFSSVKTDPYYHTNNDTESNLNFGYCRAVTMVSFAILAEKNF